MINRFLWKALPPYISRAISTYRTFCRNQEKHRFLRDNQAHDLDSTKIEHLKVVADRRSLLESMPKGGIVAEVGVAAGDFSELILKICRPEKLYLIDLWAADSQRYGKELFASVNSRFENEIQSGIVEFRRGYSWDELQILPDDSLDWAYIDAAHDFDSVSRDLASCYPKVRRHGFIAGHDYTVWGGNGLNRFGVVEAVNQFCIRHNWELIYLTNERHRHLSYALRRVSAAGNDSQSRQ